MDAVEATEEKRLGGSRRSARSFGALMAVLLLAGVAYVMWWSVQPPVLLFTPLPDGSRFALASVTFGTVHQFDPAPPLFRLARWLKMPQKVPNVVTVTSGTPETRAWFYIRQPKKPQRSLNAFMFAEDEHGCPLDDGEFDPMGAGEGGDSWFSLKPPQPLAEGQALTLRAIEFQTGTEMFSLHIDARSAPSARRPTQVLTPRPLPQTASGKGMRATLLSLTPVEPPAPPHYEAAVRASDSSGAPWSLISLTAEDRYGQASQPMEPYKREKLMEGAGFPFDGLCRREPAWKLLATLAPEPSARVVPDRTWDFTLTPGITSTSALQRGQTLDLHQNNPRPGVATQVGANLKLLDLRVNASPRFGPSRLVLTKINGKDARAVVASLAGRLPENHPVVLSKDLTREGNWFGDFTVPVPANAQKTRYEFAEYVGRAVEFVVKPPASR